ncbi:lantibiotic dehydratase family protein, partial [Bacteroidota bacterium]
MNENNYSSFDKFVLRTPLFPFSYLKKNLLPGADIKLLIIRIWKIKLVREAVFLASPDLFEEIGKIIQGKEFKKKYIWRIYISLLQYFIRMCSRSTPFGLFAGVNVGNLSEKTSIVFDNPENIYRHTRLDMNYLCALASDLNKQKYLRSDLKYFSNNSIYNSGDSLRYIEYRYDKGKRTHHMVSIDRNQYIEKILRFALHGVFGNDIVGLLIEEGINITEAEEYINELINSQVLICELEPAITGPEFFDQILEIFDKYQGTDIIRSLLEEVSGLFREIDNKANFNGRNIYNEIIRKLDLIETKYNRKFLFQTDLIKKPVSCEINKRTVRNVLKAIIVLDKLRPSSKMQNLTDFAKKYTQRYHDVELPLLEVLDVESGIGYPVHNKTDKTDISELIDDIQIFQNNEENYLLWDKTANFLMSKYQECNKKKEHIMEIHDSELKEFIMNQNSTPNSFSTMVYLNEKREQESDIIIIENVSGAGAANLNARFCHADVNMQSHVDEVVKKEQLFFGDKILAEIVHLPEARTGNILLRPVLRDYEIPYLAKSGINKKYQIQPGELKISVNKEGRIILRSEKLNKEILPRLTTAHNY